MLSNSKNYSVLQFIDRKFISIGIILCIFRELIHLKINQNGIETYLHKELNNLYRIIYKLQFKIKNRKNNCLFIKN